jgi:glycosyltransferase involved in cell wall biosynthesis
MKILQVAQFFSPVHGGSAEVPYQLSKELAKRGHEVTIYASDYKSSQEYINTIPGVVVCLFRSWLNYAKFHVTPGMIKRAKKEIKNFDIVHMHNYRTFQNIPVHYYAKKYKIPYVLQAHGSVLPIFQREGLKKIFDLSFGYRILRDAAKVIALTKTEAEQYNKMGVDENKIEIVPNGIDLSEYDNLPGKGEFRRKYKIKDDEKIILYLGRIHKIKGIDLLVKSFSDLIKELDNVRLVIVGPDDEFLSTLKKQINDLKISDKILLTGPLYEQDKLEAYVDANVYVLPSVYETFPVTVLEACACGTPVVVTDRCGITDIVDKVGYVVKYDEPLKDTMFKILSDEELGRFGERGNKWVEEEFGWNTIVEQILNVYKGVIRDWND